MKSVQMRYFMTMVLVLLSVLPVCGAISAPVTVDVEGFASISGGRKDAAREAALNNAFRRAIEQVVGVMVDSKTAVENSQLLNDNILSKSSGFIKTYRITGEAFDADSCRVSINATVSTVRLEKGLDDIGMLMRKLGKPRIAVVMTEQNIGNDGPVGSLSSAAVSAGIAESVIHDVFGRKGYNLVDRETLVAIAARERLISSGSVPVEAALQVAAGGGAEVVIIGQAVAKAGASAISGTNMRSSQATITARVVDADTGQLVASYSARSTVAHVNPTAGGSEALSNAARELAEQLNRQIVSKWSRKVAGTRTARISISGIAYNDIARLRGLMRQQLVHVEDTVERGFRNGTLMLDAEITCPVKALTDEIMSARLNGFRFRVLSYTGNTLKLKMIRR